jgi:hypothetical protein
MPATFNGRMEERLPGAAAPAVRLSDRKARIRRFPLFTNRIYDLL